MRGLLALVLVMASTLGGWARPVLVTSGEHRDFTRIVLQFDGTPSWQFGRTLDGYALRLPGQVPSYDLNRAFALIGKTRLAALAQDPATGDLQLGIACPCHAVPFEFRPGIVVIDLYDGAPAAGSSFEEPLAELGDQPRPAPEPDGATADASPQPEAIQPDADALVGGYDWTRLALMQMGLDPGTPLREAKTLPETPVPPALEPDIDKMRKALVEQMGAGATAGLIDLAPQPGGEGETAPASHDDRTVSAAESLRAHLGETPDLALHDVGTPAPPLTADGATCLPDEALDLQSWGAERPVAEQLGPIRQGMVGEFDKPSADAVRRVARFYLYIGFGAEARSLLSAWPGLLSDEAELRALSFLVDGQPDPSDLFEGMEDCDTAAALWAVIAHPGNLPKDEVGRSALARSFSALPVSVRRLLGPRLVETFIEAGDLSVATAISESVLRAPGDAGPEIVMMEADLARARGQNAEAEAELAPLAEAPGPASTDALVDLVEHRAALGQSVGEDQVLTLKSALRERSEATDAPRYRRALALAEAASGDFDAAFAEAKEPETLRTIWKLLAQLGGDTPLLTHATLAEGAAPPREAEQAAALVADRMLTLGLADQAAAWIAAAPAAPPLLRARIALANGDAAAALELVKEDETERGLHLKADALQALGDEEGAAKVLEELGKVEEQWQLLSTAQSWDQVSQSGPEEWKALAGLVTEAAPAPESAGPLAEDRQLVDQSATTRDAINALLNSVQVPGTPSQ